MHPAHASGFDWDEANEEHLARHHIMPWEVEEIFWSDPVWVRNKKQRRGAWKMVGWTDGGRALSIVVTMREASAMLYAVTGWDATPAEVTRYLSKKRNRT